MGPAPDGVGVEREWPPSRGTWQCSPTIPDACPVSWRGTTDGVQKRARDTSGNPDQVSWPPDSRICRTLSCPVPGLLCISGGVHQAPALCMLLSGLLAPRVASPFGDPEGLPRGSFSNTVWACQWQAATTGEHEWMQARHQSSRLDDPVSLSVQRWVALGYGRNQTIESSTFRILALCLITHKLRHCGTKVDSVEEAFFSCLVNALR